MGLKRPVCVHPDCRARLQQMTVVGKKARIWHSLFSSLQVCWLNTVHTFDFLRVEPRRQGGQLMANSPELRAGFPSISLSSVLASVFISSISPFSSFSSLFVPCLCQVTRQLFPSSLVRVLWAVAFEYNGPVDAPPWPHQYFLLSLSLSFLPPSLLQGSRLLFARLGFSLS